MFINRNFSFDKSYIESRVVDILQIYWLLLYFVFENFDWCKIMSA